MKKIVSILLLLSMVCSLGLTGLKNSVFPLIRYRTGDYGKKVNENGSTKYIVTIGKSNDILKYDNKQFDGSLFFEVINAYNKSHKNSIAKFQVIFKDENLYYSIFSFEELDPVEMISNELNEILKNMTGLDLKSNIKIMQGEEFVNQSSKVKYFICE